MTTNTYASIENQNGIQTKYICKNERQEDTKWEKHKNTLAVCINTEPCLKNINKMDLTHVTVTVVILHRQTK